MLKYAGEALLLHKILYLIKGRDIKTLRCLGLILKVHLTNYKDPVCGNCLSN